MKQLGCKLTRSPALIGVATLALSAPAFADVTLSYATNTPPTNIRGEAETIFLDAIEEFSDGRITVDAYWAGSLIEGDETLGAIRDGVVDMGFVNINYYPNELLLNSAFNLFVEGPTNYDDIMWAHNTIYEEIPELGAELGEFNQRRIYSYGVTPYAGVFTSPVESFDDFEGQRVRAASQWFLNLLEGVDAVPVSMPWPDLYQALETGSIDGVFTNVDGINRSSLDEAAPNVFVTRDIWLAVPFNVTINENVWAGLDEELQEALIQASEAAQERFAERYHDILDGIYAAQEEAGYNVVEASAEDIELFANLPQVQANYDSWIESAEGQGAEDAGGILTAMEDIVSQAVNR